MSDGQSIAQPVERRFRCPCCGYRTLEVPCSLALCPVCWWEDDGQEDKDASEVRRYYAKCGASHPRFLPYVRKPRVTEQ